MAPRKKAEAPAKPKAKAAPQAKPGPKAKPAPKAKAARKPAPAKPKANIPLRRLTPPPEPEEPAKRRKLHSERDSSTPEWDKNITSQNKRINSTFKMTRASLYDDSIDEHAIDELFKRLDPTSLSHSTWGAPIQAPISATTGTKGKSVLKRPRKQKAMNPEEAFLAMSEDMRVAEMNRKQRLIKVNNPKRSYLLRVPLELREIIYAHLLKYPGAIMVQPDWQTVETNAVIDHSIRRVCRQIHNESTTYLYKENIVRAVFRKFNRSFNFYDEPTLIASYFVSFYKHVVLDFNSECWSTDWLQKAAQSLKVLVAAKAGLKTLTLVCAPKRVAISETALGRESNPVTFADFIWYDGEFMKALRELSPQVFKIVIKKGLTKRLTISVDLRYLNASSSQEPHLVNSFTWRMFLEKEEALSRELKGLKDTFEEVYEDDAWAVGKGKCTTNELVIMPVMELSPHLTPDASFTSGTQMTPKNLEGMEQDTDEESEFAESEAESEEVEETKTDKLEVPVVERYLHEDIEDVLPDMGEDADELEEAKSSYQLGDEEPEDQLAISGIEDYFRDDTNAANNKTAEGSDVDELTDSNDSDSSEDEGMRNEESVVNRNESFHHDDPEEVCTDIEDGSDDDLTRSGSPDYKEDGED